MHVLVRSYPMERLDPHARLGSSWTFCMTQFRIVELATFAGTSEKEKVMESPVSEGVAGSGAR